MGDIICIRNEAAARAEAAVDCVFTLVPNATARRKKFLASKILSMCFDEHHGHSMFRGITEDQLRYLIEPEMQCYFARLGRCPLMVWWSRAAQAMRMFYGDKE